MPIEPATQPVPSLGWALPFAALLLAIAVFPLLPRVNHWWEHNRHKLLVGLGLGAIVLAHYALRGYGVLTDHGEGASAPGLATLAAAANRAILHEYAPFMVLLFSLYVISGGLQLRGDLIASPLANTGFLAAGAGLASLIGTTGASMLLIRPLLQTNRDRVHVRHTVVFFIFLVSNIGGCLLPLGDPPLFLGYLRGVPFLWTTSLLLPWLFCVAALLVVYYVWDRVLVRREPAIPRRPTSPLRLHGAINVAWLAIVVISVALIVPGRPLVGTRLVLPDFARESILLAVTVLSLATTPRGLRTGRGFPLWTDPRSRLPVPRYLPDDAGADRDPPSPRPRARTRHPLAILLGDWPPVRRARQRPDLCRLL